MIVVGGWPGRNVVGLNGRFGVRPAAFAVGGDFDNPFLNDVDPGDETTEFVGVVQSLPASGTVVFDDLGGFEHTGAADGSYTTVFTLYTWAQGGPITAHTPDEQITTTFGSTATAAGATLTAAASLLAGAATGGATAAGATLTAAASLLAGAATGGATAAGATLTAAASLLAGTATGGNASTADGVVLSAAASFLAGAAEGQRNATADGAMLAASAALMAGTASGGAGGSIDPQAVWEGFALESGLTPGAMFRIVMAAVAGRTEGIGTDTERYFSVDGSKPRITATFDAQGNRTTIVLDGSP